MDDCKKCDRRVGRIHECSRCCGVEMADCCTHGAATLRRCECAPFEGM